MIFTSTSHDHFIATPEKLPNNKFRFFVFPAHQFHHTTPLNNALLTNAHNLWMTADLPAIMFLTTLMKI